MKVGAHVSTSGGINTCFDRAAAIGAEALQLFGSQPQMWRKRRYTDEEMAAFRQRAAASGLTPIVMHGIYLINLASADGELLEKSVEALTWDMNLCQQLGVTGVIFHIGSHKGAGYDAVLRQVVEALQRVLDASPAQVRLMLENSAGAGGTIGSRFGELGTIIRQVGDPRLAVCLDTQHAFASGYALADREALDAAMEELAAEVGLERLLAVHANDSKVPLGSGKDRHENIGEGFIGEKGFEAIMGHPALRQVPFYLEVPGFTNEGPDAPNVERLKQIRQRVASRA